MKKINSTYEAENMARTLANYWEHQENDAKASYYNGFAEALRWVNEGVHNNYNTPIYDETEISIADLW